MLDFFVDERDIELKWMLSPRMGSSVVFCRVLSNNQVKRSMSMSEWFVGSSSTYCYRSIVVKNAFDAL